MDDDRTPVLVSCANDGWICRQTAAALDRIRADPRYDVTVDTPQATPYENNLDQVVVRFLDGPWAWWFNLDADNWPERDPLELIDLDLDVVGLPYPNAKFTTPGAWPLFWSVFRQTPDGLHKAADYDPAAGPLVRADAVGSGCMLVARRVLAAIPAPFLREYDADGVVVRGTDLAFCARVRAAGFRVWTHYDYPAHHLKSIDLLGLMAALAARETEGD